MSEKHSATVAASNRKRWRGVPKAERSRIMKERAQKRMDALTPQERMKISRRLIRAKKAKRAALDKV